MIFSLPTHWPRDSVSHTHIFTSTYRCWFKVVMDLFLWVHYIKMLEEGWFMWKKPMGRECCVDQDKDKNWLLTLWDFGISSSGEEPYWTHQKWIQPVRTLGGGDQLTQLLLTDSLIRLGGKWEGRVINLRPKIGICILLFLSVKCFWFVESWC